MHLLLQKHTDDKHTADQQSASCNKALVFSKRKKMHSALVMLTVIVRITTIRIRIIMGVSKLTQTKLTFFVRKSS